MGGVYLAMQGEKPCYFALIVFFSPVVNLRDKTGLVISLFLLVCSRETFSRTLVPSWCLLCLVPPSPPWWLEAESIFLGRYVPVLSQDLCQHRHKEGKVLIAVVITQVCTSATTRLLSAEAEEEGSVLLQWSSHRYKSLMYHIEHCP